MLAVYNWTFATSRAVLAPLSSGPAFGFTYRYQPPADMIRLRGLYDAGTSTNLVNYSGSSTAHKMEEGKILCNINPLYIYYIKRVTDTTLFPPMFIKALTLALAANVAVPLTNSLEKEARALQKLDAAIKKAQLAEAIQGTPEILDAPELIESRYGTGEWGPRVGPVL